ncbi:MAG TPA: hypothetical protein VLL54_21505 [Pyrinomonadaceae bacterium]|nr:hypothetical protein [Pyrinomonadaceae bacterium]
MTNLLNQLDELKARFGPSARLRIESLLRRLARVRFSNADDLLRFHETLLFLAAYPQSAATKKLSESLLNSFARRLSELRDADGDLSSLEPPDVSGLAGMAVSDTFSFYIVRWLVSRQPNRLSFDWQYFEDENRLAQTWPRFMPLLADDANVEANVPYQTWLRSASGSQRQEVRWLLEQFDALKISATEKAELYDSQKLYVTWNPPARESRTGLRVPVRRMFFHREPLIQRRDISLQRELRNPPPKLQRLGARQGQAILDLARAASTVRYRELYGFTHGDPRRVLQADLGRGVAVFVIGLPPDKRLPLRAYHAAMIFKNGVPIGYFEGLSIFERMESGFNLYYTFRDGETAWLYAHLLNIFHHLLGVTAFSIDPYQVGHENEEGIESGAFWFYRKLGFRSTDREVMKLVLNEEKKIGSRAGYRTSATTLRRLAESPMIFELEAAKKGDWDRFQTRTIGLAAQRVMAKQYRGEAEKFKTQAVKRLENAVGLKFNNQPGPANSALNDFAVVSSLIPDLVRWSDEEKRELVKVILAKASPDESRYLKLMQRHQRLRQAMLKVGDGGGKPPA